MNHTAFCFEFRDVSFAWPGGAMVLDGQSLELPERVFALVRGPSGAGKSTLLRLMNRLEEADRGRILYRGRSLSSWDPPLLRREVAYVHQMPVIPDWSVRDVLLHPFGFTANKDQKVPGDAAILSLLERVRLGDLRLDNSAAALSGGQRQRLSLVRTLMIDPRVLLLDEPGASLDDQSKAGVHTLATAACQAGKTVVMVTHDGFVPEGVPVMEIHLEKGRVTLCR